VVVVVVVMVVVVLVVVAVAVAVTAVAVGAVVVVVAVVVSCFIYLQSNNATGDQHFAYHSSFDSSSLNQRNVAYRAFSELVVIYIFII
jgi:hypothetical protein